MYGLPGNKEASPDLIGDVAELHRGRKTIMRALKGVWVLLTGLLGAAVSAAVQK
jgi:hypothetical protein